MIMHLKFMKKISQPGTGVVQDMNGASGQWIPIPSPFNMEWFTLLLYRCSDFRTNNKPETIIGLSWMVLLMVDSRSSLFT